MEKAPSRELEKFVIRLPAGMREKIAQAAEASGRSMNAEIVHRLTGSFHHLDLRVPNGELDQSLDDPVAILKRMVVGMLKLVDEKSSNDDGSRASIDETLERISADLKADLDKDR